MRPIIFIVSILLISCTSVSEQDFFSYLLSESETTGNLSEIEVNHYGCTGLHLGNCMIRYPYLVTENDGEHLYVISDMDSRNLVGKFCKRGRAWNEPLSALPVSEIYVKDGDLMADLFSYHDGKVLEWNISQSIEDGKDCYSEIHQLKHLKRHVMPLLSFHNLSDSTIIGYNSAQNAVSDELTCSPSYEIYSIDTGNLIKRHSLFNKIHLKTKDDRYKSKNFLALSDDIKPDRKRLVYAMRYMPVISIMDLSSGSVKGIILKDKRKFTHRKRISHFIDIQADDNYIYTLYYGQERKHKDSYPELFYVFDWDGNLVKEFHLSHHASEMCMDSDRIYLYNLDSDCLMYIEKESIMKYINH